MTDKKPTNDGRDMKGRFTTGNRLSKGKPRGTRHKATQAILSLLDGQAEAITQKLIDAALEGDMGAIKIVIDKLVPSAKENVLHPIELPEVTGRKDMPNFVNAVLQSVASGELSIKESEALLRIADKLREVQKDSNFSIF